MQWTKEEIEQIVITPEMYRRLRLKEDGGHNMTKTQEWAQNTYSGSPDGIPNNLQELEMVLCGFRDGTVLYSRAGYFSWLQHGTNEDIIRYMKITNDEVKVLNKEYEDILRNIQ